MREIKFRAWDTKLKNMEHEIAVGKGYGEDSFILFLGLGETFTIDEDIVKIMQYTGLKDKNGVEIYEGDIVKLSEYHRSNYENNIAQINWTGYQYAMESHNFSLLLMKTQYVEVIGNIYENTELLKEGI